MSDLVLPVALVDTSVAINALQVLPAFGSPASGGELVAPAANTREQSSRTTPSETLLGRSDMVM